MTKIKTIDNNLIDFEIAVQLMDDSLREEIHSNCCGDITEQEFYNIYCELHKERFNEDFLIN